ncbi:DSD1 family PLP-dependent enzyme [Pseudomonas edaphica]|uniref:DSD1 family PLP-dependent enzyme n=1 Tax=Pseudomonas edaphica TaxID=2006980 RepID=A0ABY2TW37_9PSED|nr:DSD1 family PLP-dependent enzyme [Pseudomonas sp. PA-6-3C]MCF5147871.1 DSD1 family PLP-dependent enzyme [Pseudomonas sp. PA-6-3F]MCF5158168.1 DSD1 family PLP-dependent enzyme [Pseudomonas sp. PA-6-2E]MCF5179214.1 DSD1 family PLP-dependent enzyme [Pseudomonas sp. PA-6-1D]MCF5193455.1 DSD1 family PLP-dependent enzyme [Pseudomonas sp. PA-6-1H]MCF8975894.1 DSD1 family PLP-dependent enzyme [Pseudomonas edaphica]
MKRRHFVLGAAVAAVAGGWWLRPSDRGGPYSEYFRSLNDELKAHGPMRPVMLIDLDRLDHNIDVVMQSVQRGGKHLRLVEKSLPSPGLLAYIAKRAGTARLMSFHQPFLNHDAQVFPEADILMGKPLPVRSAELFYQTHKGPFDPARQLQWLLDTPERLQHYLALAQGLGTRLRVNIELDVGLHRGGISDNAVLGRMLTLISANPQHLEFAGFMGYDPFVGMGVPGILGSPQALFEQVMQRYNGHVDFTRQQFAGLWREGLTLNTAGSPSYRIHEQETLSTEVSVGTALLKPTHYDLPSLSEHVPAAFIATPVLKSTGSVEIPALDGKSRVFSWWDPNQRETFFIYGGNWMAQFESPQGLQSNELFGRSSNQEMVNGSPAVGLNIEDQVFLRPTQSEFVLLQFGDLLGVRDGKIVETWPVYA